MSAPTESAPAVETPVKLQTHAQKAAAAAVTNVRTDLGDELAESFKKARALFLKHEEDVDELIPVSKILTDMLAKVPTDKTRSAGYAELLFAYGQVTFAFAKKSIYETTILGGDVEAAALKSTLEDALRNKSNAKASGKTDKQAEKSNSKPDGGGDKEDKSSIDLKPTGVDSKDEKASNDETSTKEGDTNGDVKRTEKTENAEPAEPTKAKEKLDDDTEKPSEEKSSLTESGKVTNEDGKKEDAKVEIEKKPVSVEKQANGDGVITEKCEKKATEDEITAANNDDDDDNEDKDDVDNETLTWEQYEYARMIFEELGEPQRKRLPHVYEALGDLLLETDQHESAATEYANALKVLQETPEGERDLRAISHISYQRYLSLRGSKPVDALAALDQSVDCFAKYAEKNDDKDNRDTLKVMREDRTAFKEALPKDALEQVAAASRVDAPVQVVQPRRKKPPTNAEPQPEPIVVQPRRKVRKVAEVDDDDDDDDELPPAKKARVESAPESAGSAAAAAK